MEDSDIAAQGLSFSLDGATGELTAGYDPAAGAAAPDYAGLQRALQAAGFVDFRFHDDAVAEFLAQARQADSAVSLPIGRRFDAEFKISVADDAMSASLTLIPAQGGQPVALQAILDALQQEGVVFGVQRDEIEAALAEGACDRRVIARGQPAQAGTPGNFENLLMVRKQQEWQVDENAVMHYSDLSHLLLVREGEPLLRRIPSVPGIDGTDVKGKTVAAEPVPEVEFAENNPGAARDPADPDILVAACAGQPMLTRNGAQINALLEVKDVNLATGNIEFDGTIKVKGDVKAGMRLKVRGDVFVLGMVEAAEIVAGGNVAVSGGIIGRANTKPGAHGLPADTARIECGGSLQARFIENARIKTGDAIVIEGHARQCELLARNQITVGKPGARGSHLAGGVAEAMQSIKALTIGTSTGIKTVVHVGSDPYLAKELEANEQAFKRKLAELEQLQKLLAHLKQNPQKNVGGIGDKIEGTRKQLSAAIFDLVQEKSQLEAKLELAQQACIEVAEAVHDGVEIRIGKHLRQVNDRFGPCVIRLRDDAIVFE